jgi:hypothetical protein
MVLLLICILVAPCRHLIFMKTLSLNLHLIALCACSWVETSGVILGLQYEVQCKPLDFLLFRSLLDVDSTSAFEPVGRAVPNLRGETSESDSENVSPRASVTPQPCGSRHGDLSVADCTALWADFPRHLRRSPTPSSTSESSGTTADTFLLEDVSRVSFLRQ